MLTQSQLLAAKSADYMNAQHLAFFEEKLRSLHTETLEHIETARQQLANRPELRDDADRAQYEEDARIALRIVDRERKLLPKIEKALKRIRRGEYGYCLETGEAIGIARLLIRPTAEYCADVKAISEERERHHCE